METIIPPVDRNLLVSELTKDIFIRDTNYGNNEIYIFTNDQCPNLMREVGRLREITFRDAGGGTGKPTDVDQFDTSENPFKQLIVWNPREKEITGGYRFKHGKEIKISGEGEAVSPTTRLFNISEKFIKDYFPTTIELGRSFVQPNYQPANNIRKGMYSLDNLWDGLGALVVDNPDVRYLFGKVTMYPHFDRFARDLILYFMHKYFPDKEELMRPFNPVEMETSKKVLKSIFTGCNYDEDYKILVQKVRSLKEQVPPLFNAYMNLSPSMRTFGTAINTNFGHVEETGIIVTIDDIHDFKKDRHLNTYQSGIL